MRRFPWLLLGLLAIGACAEADPVLEAAGPASDAELSGVFFDVHQSPG